MKLRILFLSSFFYAVCLFNSNSELKAQDPIFSQFYASPTTLNPAMSGVFDGRFRGVVNYREQWNSILDTRPFRTVAASFDIRNFVGKGDFFSYGLTMVRDEAGQSNYQRYSGNLNLSFMKQLDGSRYRTYDQYLIAGTQVGFGQHLLDPDRLWFSSQFDMVTENVDNTLPSGESINQSSDLFLNVNAGLMWYAVFDHNQSLYFGASANHLNAPRVSFIDADGKETLPLRWTGLVGGELPFNSELSALPAIMVTGQGASLLSILGLNLRYTNRDWRELAIRAGGWLHISKDVLDNFSTPTATITAILEVERLNVGISYDIGINKLSDPTNGRGGVELSLIYVHPASRREKVNCPKY